MRTLVLSILTIVGISSTAHAENFMAEKDIKHILMDLSSLRDSLVARQLAEGINIKVSAIELRLMDETDGTCNYSYTAYLSQGENGPSIGVYGGTSSGTRRTANGKCSPAAKGEFGIKQ